MKNHQQNGLPVTQQIETAEITVRESPQVSVNGQNAPNLSENKTISVIMRCHRRNRLVFLEEALFSLAIQEWPDIEVVIMIQNGDDDFVSAVREQIDHQPWLKQPKTQIHKVEIPEGIDGRSTLLTRGIAASTGAYLAFLDDDDVVYHHAYKTLIGQLEKNKTAAIAVGGCRTARTSEQENSWFIDAKETPFSGGRTRFDLFRNNFIPIHSYVVSRAVVADADLYFDDELPPLEDYDFLLRLGVKYEFDFSQLDVFVCEYRIHNANSLPYTAHATTEQVAKHVRAQQLIEERKKNLACLIPLRDIIEFQNGEVKVEDVIVETSENQKVLQKAMISTAERVYDFFHRYPRLEKKLSSLTHRLRDIYRGKK